MILNEFAIEQSIDVEAGREPEAWRVAVPGDRPAAICGECGGDHCEDLPHDRDALGYQAQFRGRWNRSPTWTDAMAHCPEWVRTAWRALLRQNMTRLGRAIPVDLIENPTHAAEPSGQCCGTSPMTALAS